MRWGLIQFSAEDAKSAFKGKKARAEGITANKMFREPFKRRHCLVPADLSTSGKIWTRQTRSGRTPSPMPSA
jgi:putative SOS response-associated peptidase YedK